MNINSKELREWEEKAEKTKKSFYFYFFIEDNDK